MKNKMIHGAVLAALFVGSLAVLAVGDVGKPGTYRLGTAGSLTVSDEGFGKEHITTLTLASLGMGNIANGNTANGVLLYTLPSGSQLIDWSRINLSLLASNGTAQVDTPDVGLGTSKATGAISVLSANSLFENIMTGQTATDANGTTFNGNVANTPLFRTSTATKTIYLNAADGWNGNGSLAATGKIILKWVDVDLD